MDLYPGLPHELEAEILSFLPDTYQTQSRHVSRKWRENIPSLIGEKYEETSFIERLEYAVINNDLTLLELLTKKPIPIKILDSMMLLAINYENKRIIRFLIDQGADISNAIHYAIYDNKSLILNILLDIVHNNNSQLISALFSAILYDNLNIVKDIIKRNPHNVKTVKQYAHALNRHDIYDYLNSDQF